MKLTEAISFPIRTIHNGEEIVDAYGEQLLIAADDSVDMEAIAKALNKVAKEQQDI
jgi:hypothetical protein